MFPVSSQGLANTPLKSLLLAKAVKLYLCQGCHMFTFIKSLSIYIFLQCVFIL